jgi:hypothetical protein
MKRLLLKLLRAIFFFLVQRVLYVLCQWIIRKLRQIFKIASLVVRR